MSEPHQSCPLQQHCWAGACEGSLTLLLLPPAFVGSTWMIPGSSWHVSLGVEPTRSHGSSTQWCPFPATGHSSQAGMAGCHLTQHSLSHFNPRKEEAYRLFIVHFSEVSFGIIFFCAFVPPFTILLLQCQVVTWQHLWSAVSILQLSSQIFLAVV